MSNSKEQSAIDAIYNLVSAVETIDKRLTVIDSNIKLLNNKVAKLTKAVSGREVVGKTPMAIDPPVASYEKSEGIVLGNITAFGYIVDPQKKPMNGASIDVINGGNKVIKNVETDKNGYWSVRLPPGKYEVKYKMKGFKAVSRIMDLKNGIKKYEVR